MGQLFIGKQQEAKEKVKDLVIAGIVDNIDPVVHPGNQPIMRERERERLERKSEYIYIYILQYYDHYII